MEVDAKSYVRRMDSVYAGVKFGSVSRLNPCSHFFVRMYLMNNLYNKIRYTEFTDWVEDRFKNSTENGIAYVRRRNEKNF